MLKIYNSLSKQIETFDPINPPHVGFYTCGPTVYDYAHIGHIRKYVGDDLIKQVLRMNGYQVKHVMNITDVGHLVSDADDGDDKLEKGAKEKNMDVWELAKFFENNFFESMDKVNIERADVVARATEHIGEQIKLIEQLIDKGYTYQTEEAIYFDVSKFPTYTQLFGQKLEDKQTSREDVIRDPKKKNPADFVLWFFLVGRFADHVMRWPAPWGEGFPGWHIECSAMSMEYLGNTFDMHTGGIDHLTVHHPNEIAQSEAATGQKFVNYWVHHGFLMVDGEKMSKSKKNFYTIDQIIDKGFDPLALRYLILTVSYRDHMNFTWESLQAAQNALTNLRESARELPVPNSETHIDEEYFNKFKDALNNDLNSAQALAVLWSMIKSETSLQKKSNTLLKIDQVFSLKLVDYIGQKIEVSAEVQKLVEQREEARANKDFEKSDELRKEIKKLGFDVNDTATGSKLTAI